MLSLDHARAIWLKRQGLSSPHAGELPGLIAQTGWLRTIGGAEAYLAAFARRPSTTRAELDATVASGELQVLPCVRGCMYILPRIHAALGLRLAAGLARKRILADYQKVGVGTSETAELQAAVLSLLVKGPLSTDGIRAGLPKGAVRSLGEFGKKIGISSPLPACLRLLEFDGKLARRPTARIDAERYDWHLQAANFFAGVPEEGDVGALARPLLQSFLEQSGPATLDEFVSWSGITKTQAKVAADQLGPQCVDVESLGSAMVLGEIAKTAPDPDLVRFLPSLDNFAAHRAGVRFLTDLEHHDRPCSGFGVKAATIATAKNADGRFVIRGGKIVGLWDYDPDAKVVRYGLWSRQDRSLKMDEIADSLGTFLREQVGHGMVYALDSVGEQRERIARLPAG